MSINFIDLGAQQARIKDAVDAGLARVLAHGQYILGPEVRDFLAAAQITPRLRRSRKPMISNLFLIARKALARRAAGSILATGPML